MTAPRPAHAQAPAGIVWRKIALGALIVAAALLLRPPAQMGTDVSWLLTAGEKILGGAKAYGDIIETNPPAAILVYMPAILLGRAAGMAPESMVTLLVFLGAGASLALAWRILKPAPSWHGDLLAAFAAALLLIFPADAFAQRDHIALIGLLPMLACFAARVQEKPVSPGASLAAGVGAGLALCLKPHDALALLAAFAYAAWRGQARATLPEIAAAALTALAYGLSIWLFFPTYLHTILPMVVTVYAPVHRPLGMLLLNPSLLIAAAALLGVVVCGGWKKSSVAIAALAGIGAAITIVLQGKGWPYHGYAAMVLTLLALGISMPLAGAGRRLIAGALLTGALATGYLWLQTRRDTAALAARVAMLAPPHPGLIAISPDIALGQPLTRRVKGDWRGTNWGEWVSDDAARQLAKGAGLTPQRRARLLAYAAWDRRTLAADIATRRPDILLIDGAQWERWALADAAIARALAPYRKKQTYAGVEIWRRGPDDGAKDGLTKPGAP